MRGINFQSLLKNWDTIVYKLCEEVSTHDVLEVVIQNVHLMAKELNKNNIDSTKVESALVLLEQALELLDPEG